MCLNTSRKTPKTAEEDIICYKVLRVLDEGTPLARAISPYQRFQYQFGTVQYSKMQHYHDYGNRYRVEQGLHTFTTFEDAKEECDRRNRLFHTNDNYIFRGGHSEGCHVLHWQVLLF